MTAQIAELIDKVDTSEIVRDQIAAILVVEGANQVALASAAGKDPKLWKLRVFLERATAFECYQDGPDNADRGSDDDNGVPIVNVSLNDVNANQSMGNIVERQQVDGTFNIDCYGYGVAESDGNSGHIPGDEKAAKEAQRAARLVRNILMSAHYLHLGTQDVNGRNPLVGKRWVSSITMLAMPADAHPTQHVVCARIAFSVSFNEFSPQYKGAPLELVAMEVTRSSTGQLLLAADFPQTEPWND